MRGVDGVPDPQSHVLRKVGNQIPILGGVQGDAAEGELGLRPREPHVGGLGPKVGQLGFCHHVTKKIRVYAQITAAGGANSSRNVRKVGVAGRV